jgi:hypothetical protein
MESGIVAAYTEVMMLRSGARAYDLSAITVSALSAHQPSGNVAHSLTFPQRERTLAAAQIAKIWPTIQAPGVAVGGRHTPLRHVRDSTSPEAYTYSVVRLFGECKGCLACIKPTEWRSRQIGNTQCLYHARS